MISFTYIHSPWKKDAYTITGADFVGETLHIPASIDGVPVISIGKNAFKGNKNVKHVIIEDGIAVIDVEAFQDCIHLESIVFPNSLLHIAAQSFMRCYQLQEAELPEGITTIGTGAFQDCMQLDFQNIPTTITSVGINAFDRVYSIKSDAQGFVVLGGYILLQYTGVNCHIQIPEGISLVCDCAFYENHTITAVAFPKSLQYIGKEVFRSCTKLEKVYFTSYMKDIGNNGFTDCHSLKTISIPFGITKISKGLFQNCFSLTQVSIPNTVEVIQAEAFANCYVLPHISLPNSVLSIGDFAFEKCVAFTGFTLPENIDVLGQSIFAFCTNLKRLYIKKWLFQIGFLGHDCRVQLIFLNPDGGVGGSLFYADDWRKFQNSGRGRLMLSLFHGMDSISYEDYDVCMDTLVEDEDKILFALVRLLYPNELSPVIQNKFTNQLQSNIRKTLHVLLEFHMIEGLVLLLEYGVFAAEEIDIAIELVSKGDASDFLIVLLEYQNKHQCRKQSGFLL